MTRADSLGSVCVPPRVRLVMKRQRSVWPAGTWKSTRFMAKSLPLILLMPSKLNVRVVTGFDSFVIVGNVSVGTGRRRERRP